MIGELLSSLKLLQWALQKYNGRISKKDRERIRKEAERIVHLASIDEVDKYITAPRQKTIDSALRQAQWTPRRITTVLRKASKPAVMNRKRTAKRRGSKRR